MNAKKNVLLSSPLFGSFIRDVGECVPDLVVVEDFAELLALLHMGSVGRVCLVHSCPWQKVMETNMGTCEACLRIHSADQTIPVLIWNGEDGREYPAEVTSVGGDVSWTEMISTTEQFFRGAPVTHVQ